MTARKSFQRLLTLTFFTLWAIPSTLLSDEVSWTGLGDGTTWGDPENWSGVSVPGVGDDVTVTAGATEVQISVNVTVNSLNASRKIVLLSGFLALKGDSTLNGGLDLSSGRFLVSGSGTVVDVSGAVTLANEEIKASGGAILNFPTVTAYTMPEGKSVAWRADNNGSELNFPNLATITGNASNGRYLTIETESGTPRISFPALTTITKPADPDTNRNSGIIFKADSGGSTISAPLLDTFIDNDPDANSYLEAYGTSVIEMPALLAPVGVNITLNAASHPERFTSLANTRRFIINAGTVTITNLDTIEGFEEIKVWGGAILNLPTVTAYTMPEGKSVAWRADNNGSELNFPNLATITGNASNGRYLTIETESGTPRISFPALTTITKPADPDTNRNSGIIFKADSGGSTISAPLLDTFIDNDPDANSYLEAYGTSVIEMPALLAPVGVNITLNAASHPERFTSLANTRRFIINAGTVTITNLDTIEGFEEIKASGGAILNLPTVTAYTMPEGRSVAWRADNNGSELNFPNLATITGNASNGRYLTIETESGTPRISFPALTTITKPADPDTNRNSGILFIADSGGSTISAPLLGSFIDNDSHPNSSINGSNSASYVLNSLREIRGVAWNVPGNLTVLTGNSFTGYGSLRSDIANEGLIESNHFGRTLAIDGTLSGSGNIRVVNGASLTLTGSLELNGTGVLTLASNASLEIEGNFLGNSTETNSFDPAGSLTLNGGGTISTPQQLEVMSEDRGATPEGFENNFVFGLLALDNDTRLQLVDLADNTSSTDPECLYTNALIVPANCTLDLNGLKLYTRTAQIAGTIVNGSIIQIPDSGALTLNSYTPGAIGIEGELDEWIFFSRGGSAITVAVEPGGTSVLSPSLGHVEVTLLDASGAVLGTQTNVSQGEFVLLSNIFLPANGTYRVQIRAAMTHTANVGNYRISAWDVTPDITPLVLNQPHLGRIETPYSVDTWTFFASAGQQISLDLLQASNPGIAFDLSGPNDWTGFTGTPGDSDPVTLPFAGEYTLTASGTGGSYDTSYSFRLQETHQAELTINDPHEGEFNGSGHAILFRVNVPNGGPLQLALRNGGSGNRTEIYAKRNAPPTRTEFEYASNSGPGANRNLLVPHASQGTWFVLVYAERVLTPGDFTLEAKMAGVAINGLSSRSQASNAATELTISGAGFTAGAIVEFVSPGSGAIAAASVELHSLTRLTARFEADVATPGTYDVRVTLPGGATFTLPGSFEILPPGEGELETKIILPRAFGRHAVATIYVEYANVGNTSMPAPLLVVKSADIDDSDQPILTLDKSRIVQNYWSGTLGLPPGTSHEVFILASGEQPGMLHPGERMQVPVYYIGLLQPWDFSDRDVEMEVRHWTADDPDTINWAERKDGLRPYTVEPWIWDAVFPTLVAGIGTTGEYVSKLNENARQLSQEGVRITDVGDLWSYEIQQAYGFSAIPVLDSATDATVAGPGEFPDLTRRFSSNLRSRNAVGLFGQGWFTFWETKLDVAREGAVVRIIGEAGSARTYSRDTRSGAYFSGRGDTSKLVAVGNTYESVAPNGTKIRFRADGHVDFIEDSNGNRVTATWTGDLLTSLTHTSGASVSISYGGGGRVSQVTESTGRSVSFVHQGDYLTSATTDDGKTVAYTYETGGSEATTHALTSVTRSGVTRTYTWDNFGRLASTYLAADEELATFSYGTAGRVSVHQAGGTTTLFFDQNGQIARVTDPLGNITRAEYDGNLQLERLILPTGDTRSFTWCTCGSPSSITDELGNVTRFRYDHPLKRMTDFIDAKGNVTRYNHDSAGNLLSTTYADGSVEYLSDYTATGLPGTETNRRGQAIDYTWTEFGEIDRQTFEDGSYNDFDYDSRQNLVTMTEHPVTGPDKITTFTYDHANDGDNLKRVDYPNGGWVQYFYDAEGRRARMTDSAGGDTRYEHDNGGRLWRLRDSIDELVAEYLYDDDGRLSRINKGNDTYTTYQYDAAGQILSLVNHAPNGTPNSRFDYTYDARGFRKTMDTLDGLWTYGYDATGQLASAVFDSTNPSIDDQDLRYFYDALGNRTSTETNGVVTEYVSNELNQYGSVGGVDYEYDPDGNLVFDGGNLYEYDELNRMIRVTGSTGVVEYEYDGIGNRAASNSNGERTEFLYDPTGIVDLLAEASANGDARNYVHGVGLLSQRTQSDTGSNYFEFCAIGSTAGLTLPDGSLANSYLYSPFGPQASTLETKPNRFQEFGQLGATKHKIGEIEMTYMRARIYIPEIGRFSSTDPLNVGGGDSNLYRYSANLPTMFIDPLGLCWQREVGTGLGAAYGSKYGGNAGKNAGRTAGRTAGRAAGSVAGGAAGRAAGTAAGAVAGSLFGPAGTLIGGAIGGAVGRAGGSLAGGWLGGAVGGFLGGELAWLGGRWLGSIIGGGAGYLLGDAFCDDVPPDSDSPPLGEGDGTQGPDGSSNSANSNDPNEKLGPGVGPEGWVAADALLPYRINFENLGPGSVDENGDPYETFATAPAQRVTITDDLEDPLDWSTFQITEFGFGDTVIYVPENTSHFTDTVFTSYNGKTFRVAFEAGIDYQSGKISVTFQSLEPDIDLPPDVLTGFLPPEDGTGRGMGHFSYTIRTKADLPSETQIRNVALIKFDINEIIATDQVDPQDPSQGVDPDRQALVTIDGDAPTAAVLGVNSHSRSPSFAVSWGGSDVGSGLQSYDIYVSENGGPWRLWLGGTTATSGVFSGVFGNSYRFSGVGRDRAGNVQAFDGNAQRSVTVTNAPDYRPDLAAGKSAGSQVGRGVVGRRQRATLLSSRARPVRGMLTIINAGSFADEIAVSGSRGNKRFKTRYIGSGRNVSATIATGRFRTGSLAPLGASQSVKVFVNPNPAMLTKRSSRGVRYLRAKILLTFRGSSTAMPARNDAVQILTTVK